MSEKNEDTVTVKSKKEKSPCHSYYKIQEGKIMRLRPFCERCGRGYFMGDHGDRYTCGNCGLTRYKRKNTEN